jgi:hypothetical protein
MEGGAGTAKGSDQLGWHRLRFMGRGAENNQIVKSLLNIHYVASDRNNLPTFVSQTIKSIAI